VPSGEDVPAWERYLSEGQQVLQSTSCSVAPWWVTLPLLTTAWVVWGCAVEPSCTALQRPTWQAPAASSPLLISLWEGKGKIMSAQERDRTGVLAALLLFVMCCFWWCVFAALFDTV